MCLCVHRRPTRVLLDGLHKPYEGLPCGVRREELRLGGSSDDEGVVPTFTGGIVAAPSHSDLDMLLMAEWEDRVEQGLFRYDVTECECKVVPGAYGFVAQLNEGRASKKRPTEFRIDQARWQGLVFTTCTCISDHCY